MFHILKNMCPIIGQFADNEFGRSESNAVSVADLENEVKQTMREIIAKMDQVLDRQQCIQVGEREWHRYLMESDYELCVEITHDVEELFGGPLDDLFPDGTIEGEEGEEFDIGCCLDGWLKRPRDDWAHYLHVFRNHFSDIFYMAFHEGIYRN